MWLIKNSKNKPILESYEKIISSIFEVAIKVSKIIALESITNQAALFENLFKSNQHLDERLLNIKHSGDSLSLELKKVIKLGEVELVKQYRIYKDQNNELNKLNFNLDQKKHPVELTKLFSVYFYDVFFSTQWIWKDLIGVDYSRKVFKGNFLSENELFVCSYCDVDTISSERNSWLEHFLPKCKFPYLACNINNIIPSCSSCNVSGTGKGVNVLKPIENQNTIQIGDMLTFDLKDGFIVINKCLNNSHENFVQLLNLRKRYKEKAVSQKIFSTLQKNYEIFSTAYRQGNFDQNSFFEFLESQGRNNGSYFVQKGLFNNIDEIKDLI